MSDLGAAYADARERATALFGALDAAALATPVPACPGWSVKDLLAHHVGFVADLLENEWWVMVARSEAWHDPQMAGARDRNTARHVAERAEATIGEIVEEWEQASAKLEPILSGAAAWGSTPPMFTEMNVVVDLAVHVQDARGALGTPGDRDTKAARLGLVFHVGWFGLRVIYTGARAISIRAGGSEWTLGTGGAATSVTADEFEMFRTLSGRRSIEQVRALRWEGDPDPYLAIVSPYGLPAVPLRE